jgi:uncharacterized protein (TIGR00159 family)
VYAGVSVLAVVYLLARVFDMYMTALVFQGVFAVLLVALVVVFQEDLRRLFERVATWGSLAEKRRRTTTFAHIDTLVELASEFASKRVGALIVIRGKEPLDRHVGRGIHLDGRISKSLLESLFDPHSTGHDGAVVIENNRIKQFAAHLPLSHNLREVGSRGTRHSAAVGLSELSDAFVIVVSEERGEIGFAQNGRLWTRVSPGELQDVLEQFCQSAFPARSDDFWKSALREHAVLKLLSVALACVGWYFVSYQPGTIQQTFLVPVELREASDHLVFDYEPSEVRVTLSGLERAFLLLEPSTLRMSLDVSNIHEGSHLIPLEEAQLRRPGNLTVYGIEPRSLRLEAHVLVPTELPIEAQTSGSLPAGLQLESIKAEPASLPVLVWRSQRDSTGQLLTEPIDLSEITESASMEANLILPRHVRLPSGERPSVRLWVTVSTRRPVEAEK